MVFLPEKQSQARSAPEPGRNNCRSHGGIISGEEPEEYPECGILDGFGGSNTVGSASDAILWITDKKKGHRYGHGEGGCGNHTGEYAINLLQLRHDIANKRPNERIRQAEITRLLKDVGAEKRSNGRNRFWLLSDLGFRKLREYWLGLKLLKLKA